MLSLSSTYRLESGALQIQALEGIKTIIQLSTSECDLFVKQYSSEILLNLSKFGRVHRILLTAGFLHEDLWKDGIANWILQNVQQMHVGKFSSNKMINNIASIAFNVCERGEFLSKLPIHIARRKSCE